MRRYCKTFYCDDVGERLCCASCRFRRDCGNPCLNHPSRCGLEDLREASAEQDNPSAAARQLPLHRGAKTERRS